MATTNSATYSQLDHSLGGAVRRGDANAVQSLIAQQADINKPYYGFTALFNSIRSNNAKMFHLLIANQADVNACSDYLGGRNLPLIEAVTEHDSIQYNFEPVIRAEMVRSLIQHKANVDDQEKKGGWTALATAASQGKLELVKILTDAGASLEIKDNPMRWTPCTIAMDAARQQRNAIEYDEAKARGETVWRSSQQMPGDRKKLEALNGVVNYLGAAQQKQQDRVLKCVEEVLLQTKQLGTADNEPADGTPFALQSGAHIKGITSLLKTMAQYVVSPENEIKS